MPYIYALREPDTHEVRYVGKTHDLNHRLKNHKNDKKDTRKARWIQSLRKKGLEPELIVLAEVGADWQDAERYWIAYFRSIGADLTNHTDGGEGLHNPSDETRTKISEIRKSLLMDPQYREWFDTWVRSPERRARISTALRGRKKSAEHVAKLPQNRPGRKLSDAHRQHISQCLRGNQYAKGYRHTEETRAKISARLSGNSHTLGRVMPDEEKAQRSQSLTGRPKSDEHREKIRQAALKRWDRFRAEKREEMNELPSRVQQE